MGLCRIPRLSICIFSFALFAVSGLADASGFRSISGEVKSVYLNPFHAFQLTTKQAAEDWGWIRDDANPDPRAKEFKVPYETGRGVVPPLSYESEYEVLLKGTGANPEHIGEKNHIRYGTPEKPVGFDGKFKVREAYIDIYNSHYLDKMGIKVAIPIGVASLGDDIGLKAERGIYAREMLIQTRLSNLHQLSAEEARVEIDAAIQKLIRLKELTEGATVVQYYFYMLRTMAKTSALMQSAGFQHGYLHHQQFTLAGEITDLGTGTWRHDPEFNPFSREPEQAYFKFERQPALVQNMLIRTHSVSGDELNVLRPESETFKHQKNALLGVIDRIDPAAGQQIRIAGPERAFWKEFEYYYQHFDRAAFVSKVKPSSDFRWVMHFGTSTQTPNSVFEEPVPQPVDNSHYWKAEKGGYSPNFETDIGINEKRLSTYGGENAEAVRRFFPAGSQSHVAKNYWGLVIEPDESTKEFFTDTKNKIRSINRKYGSLREPEAVYELFQYIANEAELNYGPKLSDGKMRKKYGAFVKRRYATGRSMGDLFRLDAGECHDTALLTYLFIQQVREVDPEFDARIVKGAYHGKREGPHFFTLVRTPSDEVIILDPIIATDRRAMAYSDAVAGETVAMGGNHTVIRRVYEFPAEVKVCDLLLAPPKKLSWLQRLFGF